MMKEVFLNMIADKGFQLLLLTIIVFAISLKVNEKKRRDNERRRKYKQTKDRLDRDYDFKSRKATFKKDVATRKQGDEYLKEFYLGIADIT